MLRFAIYISNHGYGHASRMAALAKEFNRFGIWTEIRTNRPNFLFSDLMPNHARLSVAELDFGVVHAEMLKTDLDRTRSALLELFSRRTEIVEREVQFLREQHIDCVVADIPFLIFEAASYAGLPVLAISNFDWHYIYSEIFANDVSLRPVINTIFGLYSKAKLSYRLPFSDLCSMGAFPDAQMVGILARKKDNYLDIRKRHDLDPMFPIALSSHGGEGEIDLGLDAFLKVWPGYLISGSDSLQADNHIRIEKDADFLDYLKAADILITKPGYSSLAEAVGHGKTIFFRQRLNYPEERVLTAGLRGYPKAYDLGQKQINRSNWKALLSKVSEGTKKQTHPRYHIANAEIAALMISDYLKVGKRGELISVFDLGSNNLNYCLFDRLTGHSVHNAQLSVGLAKGMTDNVITGVAISRATRALKQLSYFDKSIDSVKYLIGTATCRRAQNIDALKEQIQDKIRLKLQSISARDEAELAYLAARRHLLHNERYLIVDIGGSSTEFVFCKGTNKLHVQSLSLGLLELKKHWKDLTHFRSIISDAFRELNKYHVDKIIAVGLTGAFILKVLNCSQSFLYLDELAPIRKSQLQELTTSLEKSAFGNYEAYLPEPGNRDILAVSASLLMEILDRFEQHQIMVCTDGIAFGYANRINRKNLRKN